MTSSKIKDFQYLYLLYLKGVHSQDKLTAKTIEMLAPGDDELWQHLPASLKNHLLQLFAEPNDFLARNERSYINLSSAYAQLATWLEQTGQLDSVRATKQVI